MPTRRLSLLLLTLLLLPCGALPAGAGDVENGGFDAPKRAKDGAPLTPDGFRVEGKASRVRRFLAGPPYGAALSLGAGAQVIYDVVVPTPAAVKKLKPEGWYAVASVDVVGRGGSKEGVLELSATVAGKTRPLARSQGTPLLRAVPGGTTVAAARSRQRVWLKIPSARLAGLIGQTLSISMSVSGKGRVVVDDFRFDLFHDAPSRGLVGKPNGKNGPDLLASGMLGFLALTEHMATSFSILGIRKDGPAEKAGLKRSDLVVAVEGKALAPGSLAAGVAWFEHGHESVLGRAIERALDNSQKHVSLTVLRDEGLTVLKLKLDVSSGFGAQFPFEDPTAKRLRADILKWIVENQKPNGSWPGNAEVNSSLAGLALLGTREKKHRKAIRKLADFLLKRNPTAADAKGFSFWPIAFQGIFLGEYFLASGDKRALAWIDDAIQWLPSTTHASKWEVPAFGHHPKGLPYGEKALMAPCAHLLLFEALAIRCGVKSKVWRHIEPYVLISWSDPKKGGHGGMGYNKSAKDKAQFWSRSGLTALALHLRKDRKDMRRGLTGIMTERHPWMLNSHAYGEPGAALGLVALAVADPKAFAEIMPQWRWRFLNAWQPGFGLRYSSPHMGAPYMGEETIVNPAYGMLLSVLNGGLVMAGGEAKRWMK